MSIVFLVLPAFAQERQAEESDAIKQEKQLKAEKIKEIKELENGAIEKDPNEPVLSEKEMEEKAKAKAMQENERGIKVGEDAPKFDFVDAREINYNLDNLLDNGPLVLIFYRGEWCKYCNKYIAELSDNYSTIKELGAEVIAVTPELPKYSNAVKDKTRAEFSVIADNNNELMKLYDVDFILDDKTRKRYNTFGINLDENNGEGKYTLPIPATYVIDQNGKVIYRHFDENYKERAEIDDLLESLKARK